MRDKKRFWLISALALLAAGMFEGCSYSETTESERQDQILNDPMNYKPNIGRDVGDSGNFDQGGSSSGIFDR